MAKILFTETITTSTNCTGLVLELKVYPDAGSNTVVVSKSSTLGQHNFDSLFFQNTDGLSNISTSIDESTATITFNYTGNQEEYILNATLSVAVSKLNIFKAEINPGSNIIDYITVDCLGFLSGLTPTPTHTNSPTPSTPVNPHLLYDNILIYDAANLTDDALDINEILYKNNVLDEYSFDVLNDKFGDSDVLYVRKEKENVLYKIVKSGTSAVVSDFLLCPSPTPTPTYTSTPRPTPSFTPTNTITSTVTASVTVSNTATTTATPTVTASATPPLQSEDYYISHLSKAVCELPPISDNIVPYHETKKFRVDRFTATNEVLSNEFLMDCQTYNSFIIDVKHLTVGNRYSFSFEVPHKSAKDLVKIEPTNETFIAKEDSHNINIVASYPDQSGKFLVKFTITDHTAEITEEEFFIFQCVTSITSTAVAATTLTDQDGNFNAINEETGEVISTIQLSDLVGDNPVLNLTGNTGEKIVVPVGYDYAIFIKPDGTIETQNVNPGDVLTFQSKIMLGGLTRHPLSKIDVQADRKFGTSRCQILKIPPKDTDLSEGTTEIRTITITSGMLRSGKLFVDASLPKSVITNGVADQIGCLEGGSIQQEKKGSSSVCSTMSGDATSLINITNSGGSHVLIYDQNGARATNKESFDADLGIFTVDPELLPINSCPVYKEVSGRIRYRTASWLNYSKKPFLVTYLFVLGPDHKPIAIESAGGMREYVTDDVWNNFNRNVVQKRRSQLKESHGIWKGTPIQLNCEAKHYALTTAVDGYTGMAIVSESTLLVLPYEDLQEIGAKAVTSEPSVRPFYLSHPDPDKANEEHPTLKPLKKPTVQEDNRSISIGIDAVDQYYIGYASTLVEFKLGTYMKEIKLR